MTKDEVPRTMLKSRTKHDPSTAMLPAAMASISQRLAMREVRRNEDAQVSLQQCAASRDWGIVDHTSRTKDPAWLAVQEEGAIGM
ncbi:hypothetical protein DOTSEDRAFT_70490 [Dothistroma septosporum NZE10]|uniref:Uncharacterized protein n=1 Tax=Dothistroma septosporum (strain NZE10 / CBS 128990) TaxID=675120 RepID=N1PSS1_DOTSN|nr:hypothetical protein DOTSEDRAFT_70490 [Dothistroma septosporum NZE10]